MSRQMVYGMTTIDTQHVILKVSNQSKNLFLILIAVGTSFVPNSFCPIEQITRDNSNYYVIIYVCFIKYSQELEQLRRFFSTLTVTIDKWSLIDSKL